ncbi:MAG: mercury(II) reductase [Bacillota bacterium]|nr:mercury(II) reductase [Bacillota bacterium]
MTSTSERANTGNRRFRLQISGMTCPSCELHVAEALREAGAAQVAADFRRGEAVFLFAGEPDPERLRAAVEGAGYHAGPLAPLAEPAERGGRDEPGERGERDEPNRRPGRPGKGDRYDLVVLGSGGAAFAAAIRASEAGARVAMVERGTVGGTCVNVGCVPSKALLRAAEVYHLAAHPPFAGLRTRAEGVDVGALVAGKDALVSRMRREKYTDLIEAYGWELVAGEASFRDGERVVVRGPEGERVLEADRFLVATGARPAVPPVPGLEEAGFLTSTEVLALDRLPRSVVVLGAGYVALELGQLLRRLGAEVTLMQRGPRLLRDQEPEIGEALRRVLEGEGIRVRTGVQPVRVERTGAGRLVRYRPAGTGPAAEGAVEAEEVLVATGRLPHTEPLALARAGVALGPRGGVQVDGGLRSSNPAIYAAGDVTGGPQYVYVAAHEGRLAAENALGLAHREVDLSVLPSVIFTDPSVASVGLTEAAARQAGYDVRTAVLPLEAIPRALVNRATTGLYKLVADASSGRLLGAHLLAEEAGEVIYAASLAVRFGLTVADLTDGLAPYLTMAEGLRLAALAFDKEVNLLSCCAG